MHYWRDKRGHEVDFVIARRHGPPIAVECKWSASDLILQESTLFAGSTGKASRLSYAKMWSGLQATVGRGGDHIHRVGGSDCGATAVDEERPQVAASGLVRC